MIEIKPSGKLCFYYEMFMERAYGTYEICVQGCCAIDMKMLMMAEDEKDVSFESKVFFEEQLLKIKKLISEAFDFYLAKPRIPEAIQEELKQYKELVAVAISAEELMKIIIDTIDLTVDIHLDME